MEVGHLKDGDEKENVCVCGGGLAGEMEAKKR